MIDGRSRGTTVGVSDDVAGLAEKLAARRSEQKQLAEEVSRLEEQTRIAAIEVIERVAEQAGLSATDICSHFGGAPKQKSRSRRGAKASAATVAFRSPAGETWSGSGRKPNWVKAVEAKGGDLEAFRVGEQAPVGEEHGSAPGAGSTS